MIAHYDRKHNPASYDIVTFLLQLERERIARCVSTVEIVIQPGPCGGFRQDDLPPRSIAARQQMLDNVVVPMCQMLPCVTSVLVPEIRHEPKCYGSDRYMVGFTQFVDAMTEGCRPLRPEGSQRALARRVTMTLRESQDWPTRNSKVDQWCQAARELSQLGFEIIVIRDTAHADEPLSDLTTDPEASCVLARRARLYRSAACNLFINNGPAWFCMALDAPTVILRPATEDANHVSGAAGLASYGIKRGHDLPRAPNHQRIVWADDTRDNIVAACRAFLRRTNDGSGFLRIGS